MTYQLSQITKELSIDFQGEDIAIDGIHTLSEATSTQLSFFTDSKYALQLKDTKAGAVLIDAKHATLLPSTTIALITDVYNTDVSTHLELIELSTPEEWKKIK